MRGQLTIPEMDLLSSSAMAIFSLPLATTLPVPLPVLSTFPAPLSVLWAIPTSWAFVGGPWTAAASGVGATPVASLVPLSWFTLFPAASPTATTTAKNQGKNPNHVEES